LDYYYASHPHRDCVRAINTPVRSSSDDDRRRGECGARHPPCATAARASRVAAAPLTFDAPAALAVLAPTPPEPEPEPPPSSAPPPPPPPPPLPTLPPLTPGTAASSTGEAGRALEVHGRAEQQRAWRPRPASHGHGLPLSFASSVRWVCLRARWLELEQVARARGGREGEDGMMQSARGARLVC